MIKQPIFDWNPDEGLATCVLFDKDKVYIGTAKCHPDDQDFMSEKTGCEIALKRAKIDYLRSVRDNELKPALATLNQLYYSINRSKDFNEFGYETKAIRRNIYRISFDLDTVKEMLANEKQTLNDYLKNKAEFYKKVRENRQKANKE